MKAYMASKGCLMQFLAEELSDPNAEPCGRCASCTGELLPEGHPEDLVRAALEFLERLENPFHPRKKWPAGLRDPGMRGNIAIEHQAQEGRALCRWGDPGLVRLYDVASSRIIVSTISLLTRLLA